jgi:site-specific DNA-methyltransferase (adenine-specific)
MKTNNFMTRYQLLPGDCREVLKTLPDNSVDAVVTDPPYELGFMGKAWDATGIAYDKTMWGEVYRVLKPGGHLLSFGGSRTYHRMACAIEDAGFAIRDQIMWVYGSGFPKSHNIGNDIDKRMGHPPRGKAIPMASTHLPSGKYAEEKLKGNKVESFVAKSKEAEPWEGWGTALKPAHEPIVLARKPIEEGTVAENVLKWGVGGLNIDGCRVSAEGEDFANVQDRKDLTGKLTNHHEGGNAVALDKLRRLGRFPANLIHDGHQQVLDLFPREAVAAAPVKAGYSGDAKNGIYHDYAQRGDNGATFYSDKGSAARFFYCSKASKSDRDEGCEELPTQEKPAHMRTGNGTGETSMTDGFQPTQRKNTHPTVKPTELMRYLVRLVTPPNGVVLDPFNGSGSTGKASMLEGMQYIGIEMNPEYIKIAEARISNALNQ